MGVRIRITPTDGIHGGGALALDERAELVEHCIHDAAGDDPLAAVLAYDLQRAPGIRMLAHRTIARMASSSTWPYVSDVSLIELCPTYRDTSTNGTPRSSSAVTAAWRRSWNR